MRKTRILTILATALCALALVPAASAGWEGQIDFISIGGGPKMIDVGAPGPSPGDALVFDQAVQVVGLTSSQWLLQIGALGSFTGAISYVAPHLWSANLWIKLASGWIHVGGWLDIQNGPPVTNSLLAKGSGGLFTGSRGYVRVYANDGTTKPQAQVRADFSIVLL